MDTYGYVRVSTKEQNEDRQMIAMREFNRQRQAKGIAAAKRLASERKWEEAMALAGQKKARGTRKVGTGYREKTTAV